MLVFMATARHHITSSFLARIAPHCRSTRPSCAGPSVGPAPGFVARDRESARAELPEGERPKAGAGQPASAVVAGVQGEVSFCWKRVSSFYGGTDEEANKHANKQTD